jgi:hypothetical protein
VRDKVEDAALLGYPALSKLADVSAPVSNCRSWWKIKAIDLLAVTKAGNSHHFALGNATNLVVVPVVPEGN